MEAVLVRRARNQGATWMEITAAPGVSKQAIRGTAVAAGSAARGRPVSGTATGR